MGTEQSSVPAQHSTGPSRGECTLACSRLGRSSRQMQNVRGLIGCGKSSRRDRFLCEVEYLMLYV